MSDRYRKMRRALKKANHFKMKGKAREEYLRKIKREIARG